MKGLDRRTLARLWLVIGLQAGLAQNKSLSIGSGAGYLEANACESCHKKIAETYARTGMARSFGRMRADTPFDERTYRHAASEQEFSTYRRDGKAYVKRALAAPDGSTSFPLEREIQYWFGSGNHARTYFHQTQNRKLIQIPITWYANDGWAMSPGYDRADHSGFSRKVNYRCVFCHAGYPEIEPGADDWDGGSHFPGRLTEGIDCQRCHGPGRAHVTAAQKGRPPAEIRNSIVNPARLAPDRRAEVCLQCHLETTTLRLPSSILRFGRGVFSYRPGEPLSDYLIYFDHAPGSGHDDKFEFVSEAYRMRQSACFTQSKGALQCTTCHDPHDIPRGPEASDRYARTCLGCHERTIAELTGKRRHTESRDCVSCHMPERQPSDAAHVRIADHRILRRPPVATAGSIEHNDSNSLPYRAPVALYYPPALPDTPDNAMYLAVAQIRHQSNLDRGLPALDELMRFHQPKRSEFYFELGEAWRSADRLDKALVSHEQAANRMPTHWRHLYALGLTLSHTGDVDRAVQALERAAALAPSEAAPLQALGELQSRIGRTRDAAAAFSRAITVDANFAEAHNSLGAALLRLGDTAGAVRAFRDAVVLRPETAAIRSNLASFLARNGRFAEAAIHFEAVLRINPTFAEGHSAYGTALAANHQPNAAVAHYRLALQFNPVLPVTHNNLAIILAQRGETGAAIQAYREAIRYAPDYFEAHWKLGELLLKRGQRTAAEQHLGKASESSDPRTRQEAIRLLRELRKSP